LREYLRKLGWALPRDGHGLPELEARVVMDAATAREQACWQGLSECPRTCPTEHASLCKYDRWFAPRPGPRLGSNPYVTLQIGLSRVLKMIKFRLGCHRLPIFALRHVPGRSASAGSVPLAPWATSSTCFLSVPLSPASVPSMRTCLRLGAPCWSSCSSGTFAALPASSTHAWRSTLPRLSQMSLDLWVCGYLAWLLDTCA